MRRIITTNEANIKECVVSVKVVRLDKRQMTLSVFRQIPVIKDHKEAIPWGWVNYWHEPYENNFRPALFAKDGELVRMLMQSMKSSTIDLKENIKWNAYCRVVDKLRKKYGESILEENNYNPTIQASKVIQKQFDSRMRKIIHRKMKQSEPDIKQYKTLLDLLDELGQLYIAT